MANPHKGEVSFEADGTEWVLHFSVNTICEMEDHYDKSITAIGEDVSAAMDARTARKLFWYGLRDRHPEVDEAHAGRLMSALGFVPAMALVNTAFGRAFPDDEGGGERPPKGGRAGTGRNSAQSSSQAADQRPSSGVAPLDS